MRFEASSLAVTRLYISKDEPVFKIIQLSDLHVGRLKISVSQLTKAMSREKPDAVVITGDLIEYEHDIPQLSKYLKMLTEYAPVYVCLGNHDYHAFSHRNKCINSLLEYLNDYSVNVLINSSSSFKKGSRTLSITGIDDLRYGNPDIDKSVSSRIINSDFSIALCHNPDTVFLLSKNDFDLVLAGHFHGGQIWTPFKLEFISLRKEKLCKTGIVKGQHYINGVRLYINRGLGNVLVPLRFLSRPEMTVFYI